MVRAGWIGGPWSQGGSSTKSTDNFVHGSSFTLAGEVGAVGLGGGAETWGNPRNPRHMFQAGSSKDYATEAGGGVGTLGISLAYSYSFRIF
jgi:hypothetical protein